MSAAAATRTRREVGHGAARRGTRGAGTRRARTSAARARRCGRRPRSAAALTAAAGRATAARRAPAGRERPPPLPPPLPPPRAPARAACAACGVGSTWAARGPVSSSSSGDPGPTDARVGRMPALRVSCVTSPRCSAGLQRDDDARGTGARACGRSGAGRPCARPAGRRARRGRRRRRGCRGRRRRSRRARWTSPLRTPSRLRVAGVLREVAVQVHGGDAGRRELLARACRPRAWCGRTAAYGRRPRRARRTTRPCRSASTARRGASMVATGDSAASTECATGLVR